MNASELMAIEYFDKGIPSVLPDDNPYKGYVEHHRWGYHTRKYSPNCPVCKRKESASERGNSGA